MASLLKTCEDTAGVRKNSIEREAFERSASQKKPQLGGGSRKKKHHIGRGYFLRKEREAKGCQGEGNVDNAFRSQIPKKGVGGPFHVANSSIRKEPRGQMGCFEAIDQKKGESP